MKWIIKEYASEQACEWYFEDDYINYYITGNKHLKSIGNEDIKELFKNLYCMCEDIGTLFDEKEEGEDIKDEDFTNAINNYFIFSSEAFKEFSRPCNVENLKDYINIFNQYMEQQDENIIASLLTLITSNNYGVYQIRGSVQGEWNEVIAPSDADLEGISACYFGTCAEVYCEEDDYFEVIPIRFCTDEEAKDYIIKNFDEKAEVFKEEVYFVKNNNLKVV